MTPRDIRAAYGLSSAPQTGVGQSLALFELDGYNPSDIATYESAFGLPAVPLQNVLVDGYSGASGSGAGEVTLDIELQMALASGASKIVVYEGPNSGTGVIDTYNRIATDNLAKQISTSWGLDEASNSGAMLSAENAIFQQMAAQGQTIFAASGDSGAYDNGSSLSVDDPASQPYMVGVGGTRLSTNGAGGSYARETTWNSGGNGGGGGISSVWPIPSWQLGVISPNSQASTAMRNVPDVSLDADPNTGYAIAFGGGWYLYGGTSCAAPLWSAFAALVNQQRAAVGLGWLGFLNAQLYPLAQGTSYSSLLHDIADGSTNRFYPAVAGYDCATGLGSFQGANLLAALAGGSPTVPSAPTGLTATAGNAQVSLSWNASTGASSYNVKRATVSGGPYTTLSTAGTLTATTFTDTTAANGTPYYYVVSAVNSAGESPNSAQVSATPQIPTSGGLHINPGGAYTTSAGTVFTADQYFSGGSLYHWSDPIASTDAPLYQVVRYSPTSFSYNLPAPTGNYTLKLYFADDGVSAAGQRLFNVLANGQTLLSNFDVFATAGGKAIGISKSFAVTSSGNGVAVTFQAVRSTAMVAAIELIPQGGSQGPTAPSAPTGLTATAGNAQVSLSWNASNGASSYNVKRATVSGGPYTTLSTAGTLTATTFTDTTAANGTTYYYVVSAVNSAGESPNSAQVSATPQIPTSGGLHINVGGAYTASTGTVFTADQYFSGGSLYHWSDPIVSTDAPLYQTVRYSPTSFSYNLPAPTGNYTLKLYFADDGVSAAGQRLFNVLANGQTLLSNFDVFATAGGKAIGISKSFAVTSSGNGVAVTFQAVRSTAMVAAIELLPAP